VRKAQKAASKDARFGANFTQIVSVQYIPRKERERNTKRMGKDQVKCDKLSPPGSYYERGSGECECIQRLIESR